MNAETPAATVKRRPGGAFAGKPPKPGENVCQICGREHLKKATGLAGAGGVLAFHYAPKCGLPCKGGPLSRLSEEDLKPGIHQLKVCPKCDGRTVVYK